MSDYTPINDRVYVKGQMTLTKLSETRFRLEGNWSSGNTSSDHCQLIYEALEIAAHSEDSFASTFKAMCDEWLELTEDWA